MRSAMRCRFCEQPTCTGEKPTDIRGIMRRAAVGNFVGATKSWDKAPVDAAALAQFEQNCICTNEEGRAVEISKVIAYLSEVNS
jgi:prolycopene isomerase